MSRRQTRWTRLRDWLAPPVPVPASRERTVEQIRSQVRQIEIRARRARRDVLAGEYRTVFRGRGLEFSELRPYIPGDEVRDIDWKATARSRQPMVRQYVEEREQSLLLLVDCSASMAYSASGDSVYGRTVEIAGVLGLAAAASNDRVGVAGFAEQIRFALPPEKGERHLLRIIRELLRLPPEGGTDLLLALRYAGRVMRRRGVIVVISDFVDEQAGPSWQAELARLARRHDVVAIALRDPRATALTDADQRAIVQWSATEQVTPVLSDRARARWLERSLVAERLRLRATLQDCGVDALLLSTDEDWLPALAGWMRQRRQRP